MNQSIKITILSLFLGCSAVLTAKADNPTPYKLPSAHAAAIEASASMQGNGFEAVKAFSPFASEATPEEISETDNGELINQLKDFASKYLGTRYRRGSSGPKAFDCSGFIGFVFKNFGFNLSRSSSTQYHKGEKVEKDDLRPGDLMFFSGRGGNKSRVGHVAMVVDVNPDGSCTFIHASTPKE